MLRIFSLALVALCISAFSGCKTIEQFVGSTPPTPQQVTADVTLAVGLTELIPGSSAYITSVKSYVGVLAQAISVGKAVLPAPSVIQADLAELSASIGNPSWAVKLNLDIVLEYTKIYGKISTDNVTIVLYLNAVEAGL